MPNTKSAKKALRQNKKRYIANKRVKARIKRWIKKLQLQIQEANKEVATKTYYFVQKLLDKAGKRHIYHKNKVNRLKSRLAKKVNSIANNESK